MSLDPQRPLKKAIFSALQAAGITQSGEPVVVYEFVPKDAPAPYILISQQTAVPENGSANCHLWSCTLLLDVVTSFENENAATSIPSSEIAEQILGVLLYQRLSLEGDFKMSPAELILSQSLTDKATPNTLDVHRYLRFRFTLEQHN